MVSINEVFQQSHTAVITGASTGIGHAAALVCAYKGMHVWMVDIDTQDLLSAKDDVKAKVKDAYDGQVS